MRRSPVSVLEAPAGYGKTTAVTWALEGAEAAAWYTGVENLPDTSFYWFIRQLAAVDERTVRRIETLGFLNRSNAALAAQEPHTLFGGRLGAYRYYDMDQVIAAALALAQQVQ